MVCRKMITWTPPHILVSSSRGLLPVQGCALPQDFFGWELVCASSIEGYIQPVLHGRCGAECEWFVLFLVPVPAWFSVVAPLVLPTLSLQTASPNPIDANPPLESFPPFIQMPQRVHASAPVSRLLGCFLIPFSFYLLFRQTQPFTHAIQWANPLP